jgi:hypothetical protein
MTSNEAETKRLGRLQSPPDKPIIEVHADHQCLVNSFLFFVKVAESIFSSISALRFKEAREIIEKSGTTVELMKTREMKKIKQYTFNLAESERFFAGMAYFCPQPYYRDVISYYTTCRASFVDNIGSALRTLTNIYPTYRTDEFGVLHSFVGQIGIFLRCRKSMIEDIFIPLLAHDGPDCAPPDYSAFLTILTAQTEELKALQPNRICSKLIASALQTAEIWSLVFRAQLCIGTHHFTAAMTSITMAQFKRTPRRVLSSNAIVEDSKEEPCVLNQVAMAYLGALTVKCSLYFHSVIKRCTQSLGSPSDPSAVENAITARLDVNIFMMINKLVATRMAVFHLVFDAEGLPYSVGGDVGYNHPSLPQDGCKFVSFLNV